MTNLIDIQGQIEKLQKQAADIKSKEFSATVRDIQAKNAGLWHYYERLANAQKR